MSSLRLALKMSMEATAPPPAAGASSSSISNSSSKDENDNADMAKRKRKMSGDDGSIMTDTIAPSKKKKEEMDGNRKTGSGIAFDRSISPACSDDATSSTMDIVSIKEAVSGSAASSSGGGKSSSNNLQTVKPKAVRSDKQASTAATISSNTNTTSSSSSSHTNKKGNNKESHHDSSVEMINKNKGKGDHEVKPPGGVTDIDNISSTSSSSNHATNKSGAGGGGGGGGGHKGSSSRDRQRAHSDKPSDTITATGDDTEEDAGVGSGSAVISAADKGQGLGRDKKGHGRHTSSSSKGHSGGGDHITEKEREKDHKGSKEKGEDGVVAEMDHHTHHDEEEEDDTHTGEKSGVEKSGQNQGQGLHQTAAKTKKPRRGQVEVLMEGNNTNQITDTKSSSSSGGGASTASAPGLGANAGTGTQETGSEGLGLDDGADNTPRYQSHRAAAMVAKTKMSIIEKTNHRRGSITAMGSEYMDQEINGAPATTAPSKGASHKGSSSKSPRGQGQGSHDHPDKEYRDDSEEEDEDEAKWVACDGCGKWRRLPSTVDMNALPEQWYCSMNRWDPYRASCTSPEEVNNESTSPIRSKGTGEKERGVGETQKSVTRRLSGGNHEHDAAVSYDGDIEATSTQPARRSSGGSVQGKRGSKGQGQGLGRSHGSSTGSLDPTSSTTHLLSEPIIEEVKVNWVQCNKCNKWRKVPLSVDVDALPEEWYCSLNTWAPALARCTAKEETDTTVVGGGGVYVDGGLGSGTGASYGSEMREKHGDKGSARPESTRGSHQHATGGEWTEYGPSGSRADKGPHRGKGGARGSMGSTDHAHGSTQPHTTTTTSNNTTTTNVPVKKVTQWVQCERVNCKKWRKLPGHVNMASLPEKWYCEMNKWDPDRAYCGGPEETDSEGEQATNAGQSQLVLANSKGASALSYRRIIFGTDGRIRPQYSEKNRNGYGLFSFSEAQKQGGQGNDDADDDVRVEPTRKVTYWHSSCYDDKSCVFDSSFLCSVAGTESTSATSAAAKKAASAAAAAAAAQAAHAAHELASSSPSHPLGRLSNHAGASMAVSSALAASRALLRRRSLVRITTNPATTSTVLAQLTRTADTLPSQDSMYGNMGSGLGDMSHHPMNQSISGPQKKTFLRQHRLIHLAHTMSEKETCLWEACVLRCSLQIAPMGGFPLSRLLEVLDHMTFLQGVTSDGNHNNHHHNSHQDNSNSSNNDNNILSSSRSIQERGEKLEIARRRLCSDVESLKMTIHRLQQQGEVEVVLVNSSVHNETHSSLDGIPATIAGASTTASGSTSASSSTNKGSSVEICVRLIGDVLPIHDPSNDEMNESNNAKARGEGLTYGRLGKWKHAMKYKTTNDGMVLEHGLTDEIATTDHGMDVVEGGEA